VRVRKPQKTQHGAVGRLAGASARPFGAAIRPHQAPNMRSPVRETLLEKAPVSGTETGDCATMTTRRLLSQRVDECLQGDLHRYKGSVERQPCEDGK